MTSRFSVLTTWIVLAVTLMAPLRAIAEPPRVILPEQRRIRMRQPGQLPRVRVPAVPRPETVSTKIDERVDWMLSLDDALQIGIRNTEVVRVLAGVAAVNSGRSIYEPAISNTSIDDARGAFDPVLRVTNNFRRNEIPQGRFDPAARNGLRVDGTASDNYDLNVNLNKRTTTGGSANLNINANPSRIQPGVFPLNPQTRSSVELNLTQPLLRGHGWRASRVPIVVARIDTERSYFQLKDSLQEMVRGVIEAYWALVFARTDVWPRERQVEQLQFVYEREAALQRLGSSNQSEVAQRLTALATFRANLVQSKANRLLREAALRNVLGLPPSDGRRIVPTTAPKFERLAPEWQALLELAAERRPDIIELKLILEADSQRMLLARNQARPQLDAFGLYRWNGLAGETPGGAIVSSRGGQFTDWTLGVNFSVPLGLRRERAAVRQLDLLLARDRANLQQQVHATTHLLTINVRNLDQFYEQYEAFRIARKAARDNLEQLVFERNIGISNFVVVRQAIADWGNAVSAGAQSLLQYNTELANLERQTGTILETHGIRLFEERLGYVGPLGKTHPPVGYPANMHPHGPASRYPAGQQPAERAFELETPFGPRLDRGRPERLPRPAPPAETPN